MALHFFAEDVEFPMLEKSQIKKWVKIVSASHQKTVGDVNYIFTSDAGILKINRDHLQHDYYTDVITFDYSELPKISGDIYISLDTVKTNAEKFQQNFPKELHRVLIHGILHLIGFKDKTDEEALEMRKQEESALVLLGQDFA